MDDLDLLELARALAALLLILIPVALALVTVRAHMAEEDERAIREADDLDVIGTPLAPRPGEAYGDWKSRRDISRGAQPLPRRSPPPAIYFTPD